MAEEHLARTVLRGDYPELMTQQQTADWLGIGPRAVSEMVRAGELPVMQVGSEVRIVRRATERMLSEVRPEGEKARALLRRGVR